VVDADQRGPNKIVAPSTANAVRGARQTNRHTIQVEYPAELPSPRKPIENFDFTDQKVSTAQPEVLLVTPLGHGLPNETGSQGEKCKTHLMEGDNASRATGLKYPPNESATPLNTEGENQAARPVDPSLSVGTDNISEEKLRRAQGISSTDFSSKSPTQLEVDVVRDAKHSADPAAKNQVLRATAAGQTFASAKAKDTSKILDMEMRARATISSRYVTRIPLQGAR
jgi:hypothetical protein